VVGEPLSYERSMDICLLQLVRIMVEVVLFRMVTAVLIVPFRHLEGDLRIHKTSALLHIIKLCQATASQR
jgi:hypothetical protein